MNSHTEQSGVSGALTRFVMGAGPVVMYVNGILVLVIVIQVLLRYAFGRGLVTLEELEWHLWAVAFLFGLSYCVANDSNIRMDLLCRKLSARSREWMDAFGILFLVLPFVVVMFVHGLDFVHHSWVLSERSEAPLGLPYRWVIKSFVPICMAMLGLAALARLIRAFEILRKRS